MRKDIAIIGGGLAGSTAAAMLGRAGISTILVDPHKVYPSDFRCEKLDEGQVGLLRKTGIAEPILAASTLHDEISIARFGRLVTTRAAQQYGILYDTLVNTVRAQIPQQVHFVEAKATAVSTSADEQSVTLSNGESISARLLILANGLNIGLRHTLGIARVVTSECHSITIGFDVEPRGRPQFDFRALTYFPECATDRMAYLALFPIGSTMRANLFVYRDMHDPWLREMRKTPEKALHALMPGLRKLVGDFAVNSDVKIRPIDLYITNGHRQAGIVLVGDAFGTSCPAAGTGTYKVFNDVERLCNIHIPRWLASDGMSEQKIAAFYNDPAKVAGDRFSGDKAYYLRALSIDTGLIWRAHRWARFLALFGLGSTQRAAPRQRLEHQRVATGTSAH